MTRRQKSLSSFSARPERRCLLVCVVAFVLASPSFAAPVFSNLGPGSSYDITQGNGVGNDFVGDTLAEGVSFIPKTNAIFGSFSLALSCGSFSCPAPETFTAALMTDNSDAPGSALESFLFTNVVLGGLNNNNSLISATSLLNPSLIAGTRYWITVSSSASFSIAWNLNSTASSGDQSQSTDGGKTWFTGGLTPSAFQVDSPSTATPEPSTTLLLSSALLCGIGCRRLIQRVP